jgi:putative transposase
MSAVSELAAHIPVTEACEVLGIPRSSWYRAQQPATAQERRYAASLRALSPKERTTVRDLLNSERFQDQSLYEVYATLLEEGVYYCSIRTMYRILEAYAEVQERRNQLRHPLYTKPELLATAPNQLWSWDITKLRGPVTGQYYYLYVILDVFSRYVVGWLVEDYESADLAQHLIAESCRKQSIARDQLTLHADRGPAMIANSLAQFLLDLDVVKSHSRPYTPNDNPFSEAQFKTMKYQPDYPQRFDSQEHARLWLRAFFPWYNDRHHHVALGLFTPAAVHYRQTPELIRQRQAVLDEAYRLHPERFVHGTPTALTPPDAVGINLPPSLSSSSKDTLLNRLPLVP